MAVYSAPRTRPARAPRPYANKELEHPQTPPRELVDPGWLPPGNTPMRRQMSAEANRQFGGRAYIQKIPPGGATRKRAMDTSIHDTSRLKFFKD
jgi:hypothetical protein